MPINGGTLAGSHTRGCMCALNANSTAIRRADKIRSRKVSSVNGVDGWMGCHLRDTDARF